MFITFGKEPLLVQDANRVNEKERGLQKTPQRECHLPIKILDALLQNHLPNLLTWFVVFDSSSRRTTQQLDNFHELTFMSARCRLSLGKFTAR